jgi:hypothetical protein
MQKLFSRRAALFPVLLLGAVGGMPAAHAQIGPMDPNQMAAHAADRVPAQTSKVLPQPPALPGAVSSGGAAPATKIPLDMSPNDALFDAINRGDVAAARDALGRGADLRAHNILGMTPMEVSVDLGRNDISFLLLSYRGSDQSGGRQPPTAVAAAAQPATSTKATPAKTASRNPIVPVKAEAPVPTPAAPQTPRLFANDGGTPVPSAGFLGFGSQGGPR